MEKLDYLIKTLNPNEKIPKSLEEKEWLLRTLMNIWEPKDLSKEFFSIQDSYLQEKLLERKITNISNLKEIQPNIYLWQGDITTLEVDGIVNAANKALLGCFVPHHRCIDNAIHSQAGLQLRLECLELMKKQNHFEKTGEAKITNGYNLPAKYVIHTVGPIIYSSVEDKDKKLLESCYKSSLQLAVKNNLKSIAFCCISTGEFRFPNNLAAEIAVKTVKDFLEENSTQDLKVVFNVFKDSDKEIYTKLLEKK
ncbi:protein-ADP-ribose hydrolase [Gemella cuniculi]|uniref:protein-ADP-ribose hydrolase n=1 Tax=Gemella cuniculi TaxID=150240 RepID=UPI00040F17E1|nr:protein-ADP-ribose hydrolase [Gemella cuniculi]